MIPYMVKHFAGVIELRILPWDCYPVLLGWTQCNHKSPYELSRRVRVTRKRSDNWSRGQKERDLKVLHCYWLWICRKVVRSKECRRPWQLVEAADAPSEPPRGDIPANTLTLAGGDWLWTWPPGTAVQLLSRVRLFSTLWSAAHQPSLSFTVSWSLLRLLSTELMKPSNRLILCCPLLLLPPIFPSIREFSNESVLRIRWPNYWSF